MKHIRSMKAAFFAGFFIILALLWIDEIFDLPYRLLGAPPSPINYREALLESFLVLAVLVLFTSVSVRISRHIKYLEGLTVICANCKKVRIRNDWVPIEEWVKRKTDVLFSHGVCPECLKELYPEEYLSLVRKGKIVIT